METRIFEDYISFLQREDKALNGVDSEHAAKNPGWDEELGNSGCWNCSKCTECYRCENCLDCDKCVDCSNCRYCVNRRFGHGQNDSPTYLRRAGRFFYVMDHFFVLSFLAFVGAPLWDWLPYVDEIFTAVPYIPHCIYAGFFLYFFLCSPWRVAYEPKPNPRFVPFDERRP